MDLLMQIEESFDISIPLNMIPEIRTVADLTRVIEQLTEEEAELYTPRNAN